MTPLRVFLTVLFFVLVPSSYSVGKDSLFDKEVEIDDIRANEDDFKKVTSTPKEKPEATMLATCEKTTCHND